MTTEIPNPRGQERGSKDSPLGDRAGTPKRWTPEEVKKVSEEEVKNPADGPDVKPPDDRESKE